MGAFIDIKSADGFVFPAWESRPTGTAKGAVVVLQEIFGVNAHIKAVADGFAEQGYHVLAPATFHRAKAGVDLGYTQDDMGAGFALKTEVEALPAPGVLQDIQACVDRLAASGKVGVVGYCWGGLLTWRSACLLKGISAAAPYYGGGMTTEAEAARRASCPVLAHFGDQDHWIPMDTVEAFRQAQSDVEVQVYNANHGFNCDHRASYNEAAAKLARERTLAFFARHLG